MAQKQYFYRFFFVIAQFGDFSRRDFYNYVVMTEAPFKSLDSQIEILRKNLLDFLKETLKDYEMTEIIKTPNGRIFYLGHDFIPEDSDRKNQKVDFAIVGEGCWK